MRSYAGAILTPNHGVKQLEAGESELLGFCSGRRVDDEQKQGRTGRKEGEMGETEDERNRLECSRLPPF